MLLSSNLLSNSYSVNIYRLQSRGRVQWVYMYRCFDTAFNLSLFKNQISQVYLLFHKLSKYQLFVQKRLSALLNKFSIIKKNFYVNADKFLRLKTVLNKGVYTIGYYSMHIISDPCDTSLLWLFCTSHQNLLISLD